MPSNLFFLYCIDSGLIRHTTSSKVCDAEVVQLPHSYLFIVTFKKYGIGVKWVKESSPEAFAAAIDDKTKAIYVESIANPKYTVSDLPALAKVSLVGVKIMDTCDLSSFQIAHDHGIPLVVDNTFGMGGTSVKILTGCEVIVS
jgi:O-acetylhomoserine/O-acetylserine sulfhydrylase